MADYVVKSLSISKTMTDGSTGQEVTNTYIYEPPSGVYYGVCSTAAGTQIKEVTVSDIDELTSGLAVRVKFTYAQTYSGTPKLQITGSDLSNPFTATDIYKNDGTAAGENEWVAGAILDFVYDGTNFAIINYVDISGKADKADTVLTTTLSRGRLSNTTIGTSSFAFGDNVEASGTCSHAEGTGTKASGSYSHAEGNSSYAIGTGCHAEGCGTEAANTYTHAEGYHSVSQGNYSHAEGYYAKSQGSYSHAEGYYTTSQGSYSHAEGSYTLAKGSSSHSEGKRTYALSENEHVSGAYNLPIRTISVSEWSSAVSYTVGSVVKYTVSQGSGTSSLSYYLCIADNTNTNPLSNASCWLKCLNSTSESLETIGNGTASSYRANARVLLSNGNEFLRGNLYVNVPMDRSDYDILTSYVLSNKKVATIGDLNSHIHRIELEPVTNSSGSYSKTTYVNQVTSSMKILSFEPENPNAFLDDVTFSTASGSITLECDNVVGSSRVWVTIAVVAEDWERVVEESEP